MIICCDQRTGSGCGAINPNTAQYCEQCGMNLRFALVLHAPGSRVGNYEIVRILGHGMYGAVYEARSIQQPDLHVALKESLDPTSIRTFRDEFAVLRHLEHPGLPHYYELFEMDSNTYLVMELIPGQTLDQLLQQHGILEERQVLDYAQQICDVLHYLHTYQPRIIHRDIKPTNIRLTPDGKIKLVDFGLVKQGTQQTRHTLRGIGTPAYAPIEQYGGGLQTDPRSDIYSLGATLYHLLTGYEPLPAPDRVATTPDPLPPIFHYNPRLSQHVGAAVHKALALAQQDRWPDVLTLRRALMGGGRSLRVMQDLSTPAGLLSGLRKLFGWHDDSHSLRHKLVGHKGGVWCAAYSPSGHSLASGGNDRLVRLWRVADGHLLNTLIGHTGGVICLAWHPGGQILASGDANGNILLWYPDHANPVPQILRAQTASVISVCWHPEGQMLASGSQNGEVIVWRKTAEAEPDPQPDLSDEKPPQPLTPSTLGTHAKMVLSVLFSPDGSTLTSIGLDGSVRVWWV